MSTNAPTQKEIIEAYTGLPSALPNLLFNPPCKGRSAPAVKASSGQSILFIVKHLRECNSIDRVVNEDAFQIGVSAANAIQITEAGHMVEIVNDELAGIKNLF